MLLRLTYLTVTNTFALLRRLPMSDRDKDIEIPVAQLLVLQRQVGQARFTDTDRAVLAGLLHHLPTDTGSSAPPHTRPRTGSCSSDATS